MADRTQFTPDPTPSFPDKVVRKNCIPSMARTRETPNPKGMPTTLRYTPVAPKAPVKESVAHPCRVASRCAGDAPSSRGRAQRRSKLGLTGLRVMDIWEHRQSKGWGVVANRVCSSRLHEPRYFSPFYLVSGAPGWKSPHQPLRQALLERHPSLRAAAWTSSRGS